MTSDSFAPYVGERFVLRLGEGTTVGAELMLVSTVDPAAEQRAIAGGRRVPFSIVFRCPVEPVLMQRIYAVEHEKLGSLEIFLVPIGPDESGLRYEAVFAWMGRCSIST